MYIYTYMYMCTYIYIYIYIYIYAATQMSSFASRPVDFLLRCVLNE